MNGMSAAHTKTKNEAAFTPSAELDPSADLEDELRPEYDASVLKNGVRGKYLIGYQKLLTVNEHEEKTDERF